MMASAQQMSRQEPQPPSMSAHNLADQLTHSIDDEISHQPDPYQSVAQSHGPVVQPPSQVANLISNAIVHQKQKEMGMDDSEMEDHHAQMPSPIGFSSRLSSLMHEPEKPDFTISQSTGKPIVSQEEISDSKTMKPLGAFESQQKNNAVQKTLEAMKVQQHQQESPSTFIPGPSPNATPLQSEPIKQVQVPVPKVVEQKPAPVEKKAPPAVEKDEEE